MFSYSIDEDKNLIKTKAKGEINIMELGRHMDKVANDEKYAQGMNTIVDLNHSYINITFDDMSILKNIIARHEKIRSTCKWAVFVKSSTIKWMINLAVSSIMMNKIKLKVFDNEIEAMDWIEN